MRVPNWQPMDMAPHTGPLYARDADGQEAWTRHDGDEWTRTAWRETEDRQEYQSEEWWTPVEYRADA